MNFLQLVIKQMRQRALSTWLTMLSVVLGVALATAVMIVHRGGGALFGQTEFGYDIIVGPPKGSSLQLVLNTVYQIDFPAGAIPYSVYEDLLAKPREVKHAIPVVAGDTYRNYRIVATLPKMFGYTDAGEVVPDENAFEYKAGRRYKFSQGKAFHPQKFEAVLGADVATREGLKLGDEITAAHGGLESAEHEEHWKVVGILEKTYTAADRVVYVPLVSFFAISEHEDGMEAQAKLRAELEANMRHLLRTESGTPEVFVAPTTQLTRVDHDDHDHPATAPLTSSIQRAHDDHDHPATAPTAATQPAHDDHKGHDHDERFEVTAEGLIDLKLPKEDWQISAVIVRTRGIGAFNTTNLIYHYKVIDPKAVAVNPASEMLSFFRNFFDNTRLVLLTIAVLVSVVASVGILVSIYNSVSARMREIAILRALGATRTKVLGLICCEAGLIGLVGGIGGLILGHAMGAIGSYFMRKLVGEGFNWVNIAAGEWIYLGVVVALSILAGLVPAMKAYRTPVADNLVSG